MVRADIVTHKLGELADRVERVRTHQRPSPAALLADRDALDVVAFNLMLAVQASADLAAHIIADEGWRPVASLADSFDRLAEHSVIEQTTAEAMRRAVKFRNVVAHGYAGLDVTAAHAASTSGLSDLVRQTASPIRVSAKPRPGTGWREVGLGERSERQPGTEFRPEVLDRFAREVARWLAVQAP